MNTLSQEKSPQKEFSIQSSRVLIDSSKKPEPKCLVIQSGKVAEILNHGSVRGAVDFGDLTIMPGLVDTHAHINEPGRTEWEGFETATRAAAAGGITTVIDMPLNSIPATVTLSALKVKQSAARGKCAIDYGFWGGIIPGNAKELQPMIDAGVMGFKVFLIESGVDEFPKVDEKILCETMPILAKNGVPLLVHAELESPVSAASRPWKNYRNYLDSRPQRWEVEAIQMMIRLARETQCKVHIVHLSASDALEEIADAKNRGVPITAETCPHYLALSAEEIPGGATHFKCAPPIREKVNQQRLWKALEDSVLDFVVSDHSPCTPQLKKLEEGDFESAWGGISGLQLSMSVVWTEMKRRGLGVEKLSKWMSGRTARFLALHSKKGALLPGFDADFVVWDPEASFKVEPGGIYHRHSITPYAGRPLYGKVLKTYLRGNCIYDRESGTLFPQVTLGEFIESNWRKK